MKLEWMGEYRDIVEELIRYCNIYTSVYKKELMTSQGESFSFSQVQVLEYLLENEELNQNMSSVALRLGITFSSFSKMVSVLDSRGLVEKYNLVGNKKNVIIRVTDKGRALYSDYARRVYEGHFKMIFRELNNIPKELLPCIAKALASGMPLKEKAPEAPSLVPCKKRCK